ncbi:MAG: ATP-dependent DNA helicase [Panacagrimonas sp.]
MNPFTYTVAVRELCEFTAKCGDLDLRFTPAPTAQEGIAGHATVASRRGESYEKEIALSGDFQGLTVRGRADGLDAGRNRLDEVKTFRGDLALMPDNHRQLHWAQLKIYGWLMCRTRELPEIQLRLVYFDIESGEETTLDESHSASALKLFFEDHCGRFLLWAQQEFAHRAARNESLADARFPHPDFHAGQRQLAEAVYRAALAQKCLMAQAPTGIGKTIGTLFPLLKACSRQEIDKVFFLTAKTSGRKLALDALSTMRETGSATPPRVLELVARDKACEYPDRACHGDSCPLAKGFYDRLAGARAAALSETVLDQVAVRQIALQHQVCPYYLSQDLARWCDVIVGDYNYWFDLHALLFDLTQVNQWRVGVLVDEAHNLIDRGRGMYSAELDQRGFDAARKAAPASLKTALDRLNLAWNRIHREQTSAYCVQPLVPAPLLDTLREAIAAMGAWFNQSPIGIDANLQRFYFDAMHFARMAELFDEHSLFDVSLPETQARQRPRSVLCIRNVIPAPFLARRFAAAQSAVLFSATLNPPAFYRDMLGLPPATPWIDVASPFGSEQLTVRVMKRISTRYADRAASLSPIAELMAEQYRKQPGNYLAFFSSFDYLHQAAALLQSDRPDIPLWKQDRRMTEADRRDFLDRFTAAGRGIGFAVLGGVFGEGVDLPGTRLIGAFVATLGLPQLNPVNEEMKRRMSAVFGAGYEYTYLYPGLRKVVQAAGRVIRTQHDRGVVFLIDDRFARPEIRRLLPAWWRVDSFEPGTSPATLACPG